MRKEHIVFENMVQIQQQFEFQQDFYLHFYIDAGNNKYFNQCIKMCIEDEVCSGVVFHVEQNRFIFEKLFFLKDMIEQLLFSGRKVGICGLPPCIPRTLLGGYLYMRFINNQVEQNPKIVYQSQVAKVYLPKCQFCVDQDICLGPGDINMESFKPIIKKNVSPIFTKTFQAFKSDYVYLNSMHEAYVAYCQKRESSVTYRTVYYVSNIDFNSEHSYSNRFVYGCDYINPNEYTEEFSFLREHVIHKQYIDLLESIASIEKTSQIAYSLAQKGKVFRESFYMFVSKQYGKKLLNDFNINYKYPQSFHMHFIGIGVDVISDEIAGYKLYFRSTKSFLKRYMEPFGIDITYLTYNSHYLVLRLDKKQNFISYKVEILIMHKDLKYFKEIIDDYDYYDKKLNDNELYNIAVEIVEEKISKINIYHRHNFMES